MKSFISKLIRAGLTTAQAELYNFIYNNPGCSVADACNILKQSKSSIYRAFDELKSNKIVCSLDNNWKQSLNAAPLSNLIKQISNRKRRDIHLINYFKSIELGKKLKINELNDYIEILNEEETYEKYLDLSEMDWDSMLAFGNWEDLNNKNRNLISVEKKFIKNRLKNGGKAFVSVTKEGPYTSEIIDYKCLDKEENRKSSKSKLPFYKPFWANAFEGNNYVHLWNTDANGEIVSTFIHSPAVADFYKNLIYSNVV